MNIAEQIEEHIKNHGEPKRNEMESLHARILQLMPEGKLWFENGLDNKGKIIANPTIGYGSYTIHYANGKTKDFFRIGMSANTKGISIYLLGINDKTYLARTFGKQLGKATVTGYCIKFNSVNDINMDVLEEAIRYRIGYPNEGV